MAASRAKSKPELVKVFLRDRAGDFESVWCVALGLDRYRIDNVPLSREKPTYGDVIVATRSRDDVLMMRRVHARGGYRAAMLEYAKKAVFGPLVAWLRDTHGVVAEGCMAPSAREPGVVLIAVPAAASVAKVVAAAAERFAGMVWPAGKRPANAPQPPNPRVTKESELLDAAGKGDLSAVKRLLAAGARVDARNEFKKTPAILAARRGDAKMLGVLRDAGANLLARDDGGGTMLHLAATGGFPEVAKLLLAAGVDPNDRKNRFRGGPLHGAATRDRPDVAKLLLAAGARLDLRDHADFTPLMCAAYRGSTATARVLLAHGAERDRDEALLLAAAEGYLPIVKLLVAAGADPAYRSARGNTALSLAKKRKRAPIVAFLAARAKGKR